MDGTGLDSWVEISFDKLRLCNTILEAHGRQTLEAALGIDVKAWESDYDYNELEGFPFSGDVLYFDNEWWADSDDEDEFGPPYFRDLVSELAVSPIRSILDWGDSSVSLRVVLTLADIFCNKILDGGTLDSPAVARMSPYLQLLNSIGQWQKSGVLFDKDDGLKGTAVDDLCRLAGSAQCTLPHDKVFGLLGLLPQAISSKITINYNQDEAELISKFTAAISIANENSGNLEGVGDAKLQSTTGNSIYALQDMPGKGKGLVAIKKISKATRILFEKAVVTVSKSVGSERLQTSICKQVEALSENQRRDFLSMHNIHLYRNAAKQYLGIFRTNSLPAEAVGDKGAIFLEACRINHACDNNAQKNWNKKIKRHTVHTLRDINKGEEITITYLAPLKNRKARQKAFQEKFDFIYLCNLCSLPLEQSQESDRRLEKIYRLNNVIDQLVDEAPQGLEPSDFENWLWRREKPKALGQLANLRSRAIFPGFTDLPDENDADQEFYKRSNIGTYRPRRHWCFFGKIVDFASLLRLQMEIKDINGTTIPRYFYTDSRGSELALGQVQKGYTVAILYAECHAFMFCKPGIRHEDPQTIKVL
ncbi:hypothetical protein MMC17_009460 [Xylographa soralifera]|nr:hypothetical protein [Xylographa soralifera]